ncbi:hypothetical protein ADIS_0784 [Lunatimonas lonarensis]|uniref:Uncharacterized protein n=1 Tax=Lunatimonas lonarensis TaxID=1232681 RepID=R7ZXU2_9BACT|nr:hypothetical protein ADIS_0784 [Lunatimonas lonarensis]
MLIAFNRFNSFSTEILLWGKKGIFARLLTQVLASLAIVLFGGFF